MLLVAPGARATGPCDADLNAATYRAHDPTHAAGLHARAKTPGARVVYVVSRDRRDGWRVTLTLRELDRVSHVTYDVLDNHDGTLSVRDAGAQ